MLKLQARDGEDLAVISTLLQDALVPPGDIEYLAQAASFVLAANRYMWEAHGSDEDRAERIVCGLAFANVTSVRRRNLDLLERGAFYDLLSLDLVDGDADVGGPIVQLTFAGEAAIRLEMSDLLCTLEDFGEAWSAGWRPHHD